MKIIGALSASDKYITQMYQNIDLYAPLLNVPEKELQVLASMIISNLARKDELCRDIVNRGIGEILIKLADTEEVDIRVKSYAISALRNLALIEKNRELLLACGVFKPTIKLLTSKLNPVIIYNCIGLSKILFTGGENYMDVFYREGGFDNLVPLIDYNDHEHVFYEASRAIYMLINNEKFRHVLFELGALKAMVILLKGKFSILVTEGALGLKLYTKNDEYMEPIIRTEDLIECVLKALSPTTFNYESPEPIHALVDIIQRISTYQEGIQKLKEKDGKKILSEFVSKEGTEKSMVDKLNIVIALLE
jgi:DNA-binding transcriptional ArsR family regulator